MAVFGFLDGVSRGYVLNSLHHCSVEDAPSISKDGYVWWVRASAEIENGLKYWEKGERRGGGRVDQRKGS